MSQAGVTTRPSLTKQQTLAPFARTLTTYLISETDIGADVTVSLAFEVKPGAMPVEQAQAVLSKGLDATLQGLEMQAKMVAETA